MARKAAKREDKVADEMTKAFALAADEALEAEVDYLRQMLMANPPLAQTLAGMLKRNVLVALLDGQLSSATSQNAEASASKKRRIRMIRTGSTKFKHLSNTANLPRDLLFEIVPALKEEQDEDTKSELERQALNLVMMALKVGPETLLPSTYVQEADEVEKIFRMAKARYLAVGEPFKDKSATSLLLGYYKNDATSASKLRCSLDGWRNAIEITNATQIVVENNFDLHSPAKVTIDGHVIHILDISTKFTNIQLPSFNDKWSIEGLGFYYKTEAAQQQSSRSKRKQNIMQATGFASVLSARLEGAASCSTGSATSTAAPSTGPLPFPSEDVEAEVDAEAVENNEEGADGQEDGEEEDKENDEAENP